MLEVSNLTVPGEFEDVTFTLHEGEILGLFGYLGAGMTEIARAMFGCSSRALAASRSTAESSSHRAR